MGLTKYENVPVAFVFVALFFFLSVATIAQAGCIRGEEECQAGLIKKCVCHNINPETGEFTTCEWESTGEGCGEPPSFQHPPSCDESHNGVSWEFPDGVKTCWCSIDSCHWS